MRSPDSRSSSTIVARAFDGRQVRELVVDACCARAASRDSHPVAPHVDRPERAVRLDHRAHRQRQLAPPGDVGEVAERADHRDAAALLGIGQRVRLDRHRDAEERRHDVRAEQRLVALVVRMRDQRDARGDQLRPRRLDLDAIAAVRPARSGCGDTRPAARDPRARPAPPRCGSRRPTASALRAGRRCPRFSSRRNAACDTRCARLPIVA